MFLRVHFSNGVNKLIIHYLLFLDSSGSEETATRNAAKAVRGFSACF